MNSPGAVYQVEPGALALLRSFGTPAWHDKLTVYLSRQQTLAERYAHERKQDLIPVQIAPGNKSVLSPGEHGELIRAIGVNVDSRGKSGAGYSHPLNFSPRLCVEKRVIPPSRYSGNRANPLKPDTRAAEDRQADPRLCLIYSTSDLEDTWNALSI